MFNRKIFSKTLFILTLMLSVHFAISGDDDIGVVDDPPRQDWTEDQIYELEHDAVEYYWEIEQRERGDDITEEESHEVDEEHTELYQEEYIDEAIEDPFLGIIGDSWWMWCDFVDNVMP